MSVARDKAVFQDFHVADMSLAPWGHREIRIAETEMPGLMAVRREYGDSQPLRGARIAVPGLLTTGMLAQTLHVFQAARLARRRSPLGVLQYFLHAGPCRGGDR